MDCARDFTDAISVVDDCLLFCEPIEACDLVRGLDTDVAVAIWAVATVPTCSSWSRLDTLLSPLFGLS